ncbi:MAG: hypothetical protein KDD55_12720, partial [Bdellovibrionales bacterium]|nr:hypothetical protein [Bdellovibrionales bacterium]
VVDEGYPASRVLAFYNGYGVLLADNKAGTADFVLNVLEHSLRVGTPPRKVFERLMFGLCSGKKEEAFWEHKDTVFRRVVGAHLEEGLPIELLSNHILKRFVQFDRVSNPTVREELTERALAVVKAFSRILVRDSAEFRTDSEVATLQRELNKLFSKERMRYLLTRQDHFDKLMLVLSGSGLPPEAATMTPNRIYNTLTDLYTHAVLMDVLYSPSPEMRASARANFMSAEVANGDNPPFSLAATPEAQQARFQQQTEQVMHRGFDGYYGFAAMTFPFRRTPLTGACLVDDMANALSPKLNVVHAKDIHRFPGRGRYIEGIVPERVFFGAEGETTLAHWREKVLRYYGPVAGGTSQGDVHAIDDLVHTKFFFTRGATACLCPDNPFHTISGTHYSYLFFNHHFDAQDVRTAFLVPTEILLQLIEPSLEHYNPVVEPYPTGKFASDINDTPPLIETIREMCHHRGDLHGPIDLCWGSNFGGGLCNGFEPFSSPVHQWENEQYSFWDAFGHVHKWNIKRDPFILKSLHDAHQRIWEVATALQNRFDLYKIVEMQYLRGNSLDRKLGEEERFLQGGRTERVDVEELRNMDEEDQEIQARQLMENTHRMLEWV